MASIPVQAQGLSIELSVKWMKSKTQLNIPPIELGDSVELPILKLVYRNLTEKGIYFRNIYSVKSGYPLIAFASLTNSQMDLADRVTSHSSYHGLSYQVEIGESWEAFAQGFDTSKEHELDIINDDLWTIYTVLETQQLLNKLGINKQLSCFGYPDKEVISHREARRLIAGKRGRRISFSSVEGTSLREDEVSGQYSDAFIFLKPGEIYKQEVSLVGFYLLNGNYEFLIPDDSLPDYVIGKGRRKISLPRMVNDYQLYEGAFLKNTVGIKIY